MGRFTTVLSLEVTHYVVLACLPIGIVCAARFALLVYRAGDRPDPSWFPGMFLWLFVCPNSHAVGPDWLRELRELHFFTATCGYVVLFPIVVYRILFSKARDSVSPNAGMNVLMSPSSLFANIHLSSGKPGGDALGIMFLTLSTVLFFVTLRLLYRRRNLWIGAFHPSYVAFTFPVASTATATVLATERLPAFAGYPLLWAWATFLTGLTACAVLYVTVRFLGLLAQTWLGVSAAPEPS